MHKSPSINIFSVQLSLREQKVFFLLFLFCGNPTSNGKGKPSFSIVGKVEGLKNIQGVVHIISSYSCSNRLKDQLDLKNGQFIFSNISFTAALFEIKLQLTGNLKAGEKFGAEVIVNLNYNLLQFLPQKIEAKYSLKNIIKPAELILQ